MFKISNSSYEKYREIKSKKANYIFMDLEFNYSKKLNAHEITSIGAVKCDSNFNVINGFHSYVNPVLLMDGDFLNSPFSKISFDKLNNSQNLEHILKRFENWIGKDNTLPILVWGSCDKIVMECSTKINNIHDNYMDMINLIKDVQSEISMSVKISNKPINQSISLDNMKKLYNLNKDVTHNALLDAIDLSKIYKKYKKNAPFNNDFLLNLSYDYRKVALPISLTENIENIEEVNFPAKISNNIFLDKWKRISIQDANIETIKSLISHLDYLKFQYDEEKPKFKIIDNNIVFSKDKNLAKTNLIDTTKNNLILRNTNKGIVLDTKSDLLLPKYLIENNRVTNKEISNIIREAKISSIINKNIEIKPNNLAIISTLNFLFNHKTNFYNENISNIQILNDSLHIKYKKDNPSTSIHRANLNCEIIQDDEYIKLNLNKNSFLIPITTKTKPYIDFLISQGNKKTTFKYGLEKEITKDIIHILQKIISKKGLLINKRTQVFINDDRISFMYGKKIVNLNFSNATFLIKNEKNLRLILKNAVTKDIHEYTLKQNSSTSKLINELLEVYNHANTQVIKIENVNKDIVNTLTSLKYTDEFIDNNAYTYKFKNAKVIFKKYFKNNFEYKVFPLSNFKFFFSIDRLNNTSITLFDINNPKKIFASCLNNNHLDKELYLYLLDMVDKNLFKDTFNLEYLSGTLSRKINSLIKSKSIFKISNSDLNIINVSTDSIQLKETDNFVNISIAKEDLIITLVNNKDELLIELKDNNNIFTYKLTPCQKSKTVLNSLCKIIKKDKLNNSINVLGITNNLKKNIWKVMKFSNINYTEQMPKINFEDNYLIASRKYNYKNTYLSLKTLAENILVLKIGKTNSIEYKIPIDKGNKIFVDELINSALLEEVN